jgi:hypothetical protein
MAAVLACGEDALLSHHAAAALWGLRGWRGGSIDVTAHQGRRSRRGKGGQPEIVLHRSRVHPEERSERAGVPATSVARTLVDLAGILDADHIERVAEEADGCAFSN